MLDRGSFESVARAICGLLGVDPDDRAIWAAAEPGGGDRRPAWAICADALVDLGVQKAGRPPPYP